jgi:hypothetical protein
MFAEATLKGIVHERIWRYDNTTYFWLKVDGPNETGGVFTVALPKSVSRSMPRRLQLGQFVSVAAMPQLSEMTETLAAFLESAAGEPPHLNGFDTGQVRVHRLQTNFVAKAIFILSEKEPPVAAATLEGVVDQRIWMHDDMLHFRMRVTRWGDVTDSGKTESNFFTVVVPRGPTKAMPQRLVAGDRATVEAQIQQREHPETLATFLSNAEGDKPELGDYDATQLSVTRTKIDFIVKTMIVRPKVENDAPDSAKPEPAASA